MPNVLILGSGGHARVVLDAIRAAGMLNPVGFLDDRRQAGSRVDGLAVLGPISDFGEISAQWNVSRAVVAVGD
ncbi:MAG: transferase, partial [Pseudaminobacter sp.]|nr:transferase [Pseudaminobacter sp.]